MKSREQNRSLLLVGPGKHFGAELSQRFAAEGFAIGLLAKSAVHTDPVAAALRAGGHRCVTGCVDITDFAAVRIAVSKVAEALGPITCVVYNVKADVPGTGLEIAPTDLTYALSVNVSGALAVVQSAVTSSEIRPQLTIILTGGGFKDRPDPAKVALSVSKSALHALFLTLKQPLQRRGIAIKTVIIDGAVRSRSALSPTQVADAFWQAYLSPTQDQFRFPARPRPVLPNDRQRLLFAGAHTPDPITTDF